mmetsp:Transcript_91750/g.255583  ORF Transcript_91750/g.255583 Transcript_91750/m.255583 type:complete len:126 (-) Transcript_91750:356-733(-)
MSATGLTSLSNRDCAKSKPLSHSSVTARGIAKLQRAPASTSRAAGPQRSDALLVMDHPCNNRAPFGAEEQMPWCRHALNSTRRATPRKPLVDLRLPLHGKQGMQLQMPSISVHVDALPSSTQLSV